MREIDTSLPHCTLLYIRFKRNGQVSRLAASNRVLYTPLDTLLMFTQATCMQLTSTVSVPCSRFPPRKGHCAEPSCSLYSTVYPSQSAKSALSLTELDCMRSYWPHLGPGCSQHDTAHFSQQNEDLKYPLIKYFVCVLALQIFCSKRLVIFCPKAIYSGLLICCRTVHTCCRHTQDSQPPTHQIHCMCSM